jgi:signal transduction histidine kinase
MEPANILIIDDDPSKTEVIQFILEELKQNLITCISGRDGLRVLLKTEIAVILLDVNMPGLDGFETAALIRNRPLTAPIPILFITAYNQSEIDVAKGYTIGAVDYIFTPIDPLILKSKVKVFVDLFNYSKQITLQGEQLRKQISEIENLNRKLLEVNENLEAFTSSVSHDLRAPLRHITDFVDLLKKAGKDRIDGKMVNYMEIISSSAIKMGKLIEELLQFSRLSNVEIRKTKVVPAALVQSILRENGTEIGKYHCSFTIADLPEVFADATMLKQVFENLISNAIKYSSRKEHPAIRIGSKKENGFTEFFVSDNGIGFDMQFSNRLFCIFQRLVPESDYEGLGIGLAIVKRIVEKHGGSVSAIGETGHGATFSFTIPLA